MKQHSSLVIGLLAVLVLGAATVQVHADPSCYKRQGYGAMDNYGIKTGCSGEGEACFWVACGENPTNDDCNDDCFSWVWCRSMNQ